MVELAQKAGETSGGWALGSVGLVSGEFELKSADFGELSAHFSWGIGVQMPQKAGERIARTSRGGRRRFFGPRYPKGFRAEGGKRGLRMAE